jgi:ATP-dependent helicase STH1/SNF2
MKKAFAECHKAVMECEGEHQRRRCELFMNVPARKVSMPLVSCGSVR